MKLGMYGEIMGAPIEALFFSLNKLKESGSIMDQHIARIRTLVQEKMYYEDIIDEIGDIIGNPKLLSEFIHNYGPEHRPYRFTDDTLCTVATMEAILMSDDLSGPMGELFQARYRYWGQKYPDVGFGKLFRAWLLCDDPKPLYSFGNGGAMRVSPIAYVPRPYQHHLTRESCSVSHNHPEAIRSALAVVDSVHLAHTGHDKEFIRNHIQEHYYYDMQRSVDQIRPVYAFYSDAARSVPESIICFLDAETPLESIDHALSLAGDTDTMAMIAGCISEAYFKKSLTIEQQNLIETSLPPEWLDIIEKFYQKYVY